MTSSLFLRSDKCTSLPYILENDILNQPYIYIEGISNSPVWHQYHQLCISTIAVCTYIHNIECTQLSQYTPFYWFLSEIWHYLLVYKHQAGLWIFVLELCFQWTLWPPLKILNWIIESLPTQWNCDQVHVCDHTCTYLVRARSPS